MDQTDTTTPKSSTVPGIERRAASRVNLCVGVGFQSDTNFYAGFTEDISEGGLFVATHMLQPLGTELQLTFSLPNGYEITTAAVVRWLRDPRDQDGDAVPGMGIEFRALQSADHDMIRQFVALREPIFYDA